MNKCVRITLSLNQCDEFCQKSIHKLASKLNLEGVAHYVDSEVKIVACGKKEKIDDFIDLLNKESSIDDIEIEPFLKDKDYRGIFRIIDNA